MKETEREKRTISGINRTKGRRKILILNIKWRDGKKKVRSIKETRKGRTFIFVFYETWELYLKHVQFIRTHSHKYKI